MESIQLIPMIPPITRHMVSAMSVPQDWAGSFMHIAKLRDQGLTGHGVTIGILDSGSWDHPDIDPPSRALDCTGSGSAADECGHETHIAGIIGGRGDGRGVIGISPGATLVSIRVLDREGCSPSDWSWVITGVSAAIDSGCDLINMSLGAPWPCDALDAIISAHPTMIPVGASGNEWMTTLDYPAAYPHVISVGACQSDGSTAPYSNHADDLTVVAPGSEIYSTWLHGGYRVESGTSMAVPMVTGVLALLIEAHRRIGGGMTPMSEYDSAKSHLEALVGQGKLLDLGAFTDDGL